MTMQRFNSAPTLIEAEDNKQSILYVEDEDANWDATRLLLRERYSITRAATAKEAFELISENKFDLILMDIQLSGSELNGIEITKILRGSMRESDIPLFAQNADCQGASIIFLTAYSLRYSKPELLAAGGDSVIAKPVDFTRLSLAISRLLMREVLGGESSAPKLSQNNNADDRRREVRMPLELNCKVVVDEVSHPACLSDLSIGGARIAFVLGPVPENLRVDDISKVQFTTAWGAIECDICVVWTDPAKPNEMGVSFEAMNAECRGILERWLADYGTGE